MVERVIAANGLKICAEEFGQRADAPVLLIMGATAAALYWENEFCQRLVAGGRHVLRFDNRDTGKSTTVDFDAHPYALADLAQDAVGILDAYKLASAHIVGISMGGMIAQTLAIEHSARVRSLTSIGSSPIAGAGVPGLGGDVAPDLPLPRRDVADRLRQAWIEVPVDRDERIEWRVSFFAMLAGSLAPFDHNGFRELAAREADRARNFPAMANHMRAMDASAPRDRRPLLRNVDVPALVIHGTEDPVFHLDHARATAQAIPGGELMTIEGMGHELPRVVWPTVTDVVLAHTHRAEALRRARAATPPLHR